MNIPAADPQRISRGTAALLAGVALWMVCASAGARAPIHPPSRANLSSHALLLPAQSRDIGPSAAAAAAAQATGGRVLNVKRAGGDGAAVYYVKVLLGGGKVRIVRVNGHSGAVE